MSRIYLDHHATTPIDPRVLESMQPYFSQSFGNPASGSHRWGWEAEEAVRIAREQVASLIHAHPKEIIWTSGTTESINLALQGTATRYQKKGNHMISCLTEHSAVLATLRFLESKGFEVTYLPVNSEGLLSPEDLERAIRPSTILISLMAANNEIGVIPPLVELGRIAKKNGILFHVDAAQACGKIPVDVEDMGIDLLSLSAHKVYGPKGIGALYVRHRNPSVRLSPLFYGGTQQGGLRPGTLAVPSLVGMGMAYKIAQEEMGEEAKRLALLRDHLLQRLQEVVDDIVVNGSLTQRLPGNLNISFRGVRSADLMSRLPDIALSSGSACTSGSLEPSHVLKALGVNEERSRSSIRIGLGRFNTKEEMDEVVHRIAETVKILR